MKTQLDYIKEACQEPIKETPDVGWFKDDTPGGKGDFIEQEWFVLGTYTFGIHDGVLYYGRASDGKNNAFEEGGNVTHWLLGSMIKTYIKSNPEPALPNTKISVSDVYDKENDFYIFNPKPILKPMTKGDRSGFTVSGRMWTKGIKGISFWSTFKQVKKQLNLIFAWMEYLKQNPEEYQWEFIDHDEAMPFEKMGVATSGQRDTAEQARLKAQDHIASPLKKKKGVTFIPMKQHPKSAGLKPGQKWWAPHSESKLGRTFLDVLKENELGFDYGSEERQPDGTIKYTDRSGDVTYYKNNEFHREGDEPAVIAKDGKGMFYAWYKNGKLHREGGKPAEIYVNKNGKPTMEKWYVNDKFIRSIPEMDNTPDEEDDIETVELNGIEIEKAIAPIIQELWDNDVRTYESGAAWERHDQDNFVIIHKDDLGRAKNLIPNIVNIEQGTGMYDPSEYGEVPDYDDMVFIEWK